MMRKKDVEDAPNVVNCIFSIRTRPIDVLFDSGTTHSFVSTKLVEALGLVLVSKNFILPMAFPNRNTMRCNELYKLRNSD